MDTAWLTHTLSSPIALALLALLAERWLPWPEQWHPLAVLRLMASYLSTKVNKPTHSVKQQQLAGFLSLLIMLLLVLLPAALVFAGAEVSLAIGWLILLVSLRQQPINHAITLAENHLRRGRKNAARAWLSRITWRDCDRLSEHGIAKTCVELRATSVFQHRFTPLFFWFLGGPIAALCARTVQELTRVWPVAQRRFRHFGRASHGVDTVIHFLPSFFLSLVARGVALFQPHKPKLQPLQRNRLFSTVRLSWLQSFSYAHRVTLGGPLQVNGQRVNRQRFAGRPAEQLLTRTARWQRLWQGFFVGCLVITLFALFVYRP